MEANPERREVPENPAQALAAVVDNATALARAELRLAAFETRAWLARVGVGLALLWLSLLLTQGFVLLLALSPLALNDRPVSSVILMLVLALVPALVVFVFAVRELRRLKDFGNANVDKPSRH